MPISMQPDLQHEQLLPLAPGAAAALGLGNQSTRTLSCAHAAQHQLPGSAEKEQKWAGDGAAGGRGRQAGTAGSRKKRAEEQSPGRREEVRNKGATSTRCWNKGLVPTSQHAPRKQPSIFPANGAAHLLTQEARSESDGVQLAQSFTRPRA